MLNIALIGNPNTGKTSLFNTLTSSYEYIGNWAGVTVEKKVGKLKNKSGDLVDLPGIYSLNPLSKDESVTTKFLLTESFSSILNVIDAAQLKRNLHLTIQLLEFGKPMVVALNMIDVAKSRNIIIDANKLAHSLHVPVVSVIARNKTGSEELLQTVMTVQQSDSFQINYGETLETAIQSLVAQLPDNTHSKRWMALQFFEGNFAVTEYLQTLIAKEELDEFFQQTEKQIAAKEGVQTLHQWIHKQRNHTINQLIENCVDSTRQTSLSFSERMDAIITHKLLGIIIFILAMYATFKLTFDWLGGPLSDLLDEFLHGPISNGLTTFLDVVNAADVIRAVILDGILEGVGGVLVFVPQIFILFFIISLIEDSGYMARIATVMDKLMEWIGLNGKAFIPMIIGFGCNVPGIMAARTIEQPRERLVTIMLSPLMSCTARLTVYSLFAATFFAENEAEVVLSLYILSIVVSLILAKIFSMTVARKEESLFVIELPPYRIPQWKTLSRSTWEKGKGFVRKAGTFIFAGSVIIWLLSYAGPKGFDVPLDESFLQILGNVIAPLFTPIGFGNWQAGVALITGFLAKEIVVSTMNIIYAAPDTAQLQGVISTFFTPLQAYSFMIFVLLYTPCLATVGALKKETMSMKITWFVILYSFVVAYVLCFVFYQGGKLLGFH